MKYVCEAPGGATWFRIETQAEADAEAALMNHAVDSYFRRYHELACAAYRAPAGLASFEQAIGLSDFVARTMPLFLTLRADDGEGLATAMLPPQGRSSANFTIIVVGPANDDPYRSYAAAMLALGAHYKLSLKRENCYPYARTRG